MKSIEPSRPVGAAFLVTYFKFNKCTVKFIAHFQQQTKQVDKEKENGYKKLAWLVGDKTSPS